MLVLLGTWALRKMFRLLAIVLLAACYLNNPARDAGTHAHCWEVLAVERRARIARRNSKDLASFKIMSLLKNTLVDGVQHLQGQRIMIDFIFFAIAYIDSEAKVDAEICAVGVLGSWRLFEMEPLRRLAAMAAQHMDTTGASPTSAGSSGGSRRR